MRVLCLHGKGTSGAIFRSQTSSFRTHLKDLNIDFDFIDGRSPSKPAPGIDLFYPPPYFTFWDDESPTSIQEACSWLDEVIATRGPYDALLMFSQGCALGAALLARDQLRLPLPVKAAVFICGGLPLSFMEGVGFVVPDAVKERDRLSRVVLAAQADSEAILARGSERWISGGAVGVGVGEDEIVGPFRVDIPTVHVYGCKDPRYEAGVLLSGICESGRRRVYDHGGGHEIPRGDGVSRAIADLVRWALKQG